MSRFNLNRDQLVVGVHTRTYKDKTRYSVVVENLGHPHAEAFDLVGYEFDDKAQAYEAATEVAEHLGLNVS